ncbi:hypothetical protein ACFLYO_09745 [Chloroflexota bacterium]
MISLDALMVLLLMLATWRLSSLLVQEEGPHHVFDRLRALPYPVGGEMGVLACVWCCSLWTAPLLILLWGNYTGRYVVLTLAVSAGAIVVHEVLRWIRGE